MGSSTEANEWMVASPDSFMSVKPSFLLRTPSMYSATR
jgi:hypothetical protein